MQQLVHQIWYQKRHPLRWLLLPFSGLFSLISATRRLLFRLGIKKAWTSPIPIIVVGNITAGGSGKTPMVLHLISMLRNAGYKPGVVSRGYGATNLLSPTLVNASSKAIDVGDEPAMIFARTQVPMVVSPKRSQAVKYLLECAEIDVVICDDGLQHYALNRDIEIAIIDGKRQLGNGLLIPAGPLREGKWRLNSVDFIVTNGVNDSTRSELKSKNAYSMVLESAGLQAVEQHNLISSVSKRSHKTLNETAPTSDCNVVAMAGIGNPERFFETLTQLGFKLNKQIAFDDHQAYQQANIESLADNLPLLMTEKDAIKCRDFAQNNWWYLAVNAKINNEFDRTLLNKLAKAVAKKKENRHGI